MQNRVFVLDSRKRPLSPCHPARARQLLEKGRAAVYRQEPFTIILKEEKRDAIVQPVRLKIDPGSKTTGLALVLFGQNGQKIIWAAELEHRGAQIKAKILKRRQCRRGRRSRKIRYRPPRFNNRRRPKGWLPPSLQHRVDTVLTWVERLSRYVPINALSVELTKFDTQKMKNPEISGVEYQQGQLQGYDVREYLLEKWGRTCVYCGAKDRSLEVEHIIPRGRGGSNRVSNLTISCVSCNQEKGDQTAEEFGYPEVQSQAGKPLKDAAVLNATRWALWQRLNDQEFPLETGTGARTKFNRRRQEYPKAHWIDAACVGKSGDDVHLEPDMQILAIKATGRGSRQMCSMDKYGFPRTGPKQHKEVHGFRTGDLVRAVVPSYLKTGGVHIGRVVIRSSGSFRVGEVDGISWKYCELVQRNDGYRYSRVDRAHSSHGRSTWASCARNL